MLAEIREIVGDDIEIVVMHHDIGLEMPFEGALVDAMVAALQRHDPGAPVLPYLLVAAEPTTRRSRSSASRGYGFAPLQLPPDLDFPACSTASTSGCRSTH